MSQHHDKPSKLTRRGYEGFLVETPLVPVSQVGSSAAEGEGCGALAGVAVTQMCT